MALLRWIARVIWPANGRPGCTSRGALQQRIAALSRAAQRGSATDLFFVEYEMKTSCAMLFQMGPFYLFLSATAIAAGLMLGLILVSILACNALVGLRIPSEIFTPRVKKSRKSLQLSRDHGGRVHGIRCGTKTTPRDSNCRFHAVDLKPRIATPLGAVKGGWHKRVGIQILPPPSA
jgi:hypothetical protein